MLVLLFPIAIMQLNEVEARCPNVNFPSVPRADPHPQELKYLPTQISHGLNLLMGAIQYGEATVYTLYGSIKCGERTEAYV